MESLSNEMKHLNELGIYERFEFAAEYQISFFVNSETQCKLDHGFKNENEVAIGLYLHADSPVVRMIESKDEVFSLDEVKKWLTLSLVNFEMRYSPRAYHAM